MQLFLMLAIIVTAVIVGISSKKSYDKPHVVNFSIAALMLLLVIQSILMQPITMLGYLAIGFCSIAFVFQAVIGYRTWKSYASAKTS